MMGTKKRYNYRKLLCGFFNHQWYVGNYGKRIYLICENCKELGKILDRKKLQRVLGL